MHNITIKSSVYALVGVSALTWFGLALANNLDLSKAEDFFGLVPKVVSIDLLIVALFVKWGWRSRLFRGWLVPFPDINGTWVGKIYSEWVDPNTGEKPSPIPVMLTIKQSFFHVSCVMHTAEMTSGSFTEGFVIDADRQIKQLAYTYSSRPRTSLSGRSSPHDGSAVFQIIESPKMKLKGRYWTERMTRGEILLDPYSKDILEELPEDIGDHPVTEPENRR